jgi:hypothetical protein
MRASQVAYSRRDANEGARGERKTWQLRREALGRETD